MAFTRVCTTLKLDAIDKAPIRVRHVTDDVTAVSISHWSARWRKTGDSYRRIPLAKDPTLMNLQ